MPKRKSVQKRQKTPLSKLRQRIFKQAQEDVSVPELEDLEHSVSEDPRESSEGDIEEEEESGQEPYPEIEKRMEHEDKPNDEDEE